MIGIQLDNDKATVAACTQSGTEILGKGIDLSQIANTISARTGEPCKGAVIGVPAYYNDVHRKEVLQKARAAGITEPRLMNEPSAVGLAYGASRSQMPELALVLTLSNNGAFDATLLAFQEGIIEVAASNGIMKIESSIISSPEKLFADIEPILSTVLRDGKCANDDLSAVILSGNTGPIKTISQQIESILGQELKEPPDPDTAIACGAATYSLFLDGTSKTEPPKTAQAPSSDSGCLGAAVATIVAIIGIILAICRS